MIRTSSYHTELKITNQEKFEQLVSLLNRFGYKPLIRMMFNNISIGDNAFPKIDDNTILQVLMQSTKRTRYQNKRIFGEIFFKDGKIYSLNQVADNQIQASIISTAISEEELKIFYDLVTEEIKIIFDGRTTKKLKFYWEPSKKANYRRQRHFLSRWDDVLIEEDDGDEEEVKAIKTNDPIYSIDEATISKFFVDNEVRQFILKLVQLQKITSRDATDLINIEKISQLKELGIVTEEYLLTCKQNQQTICVIPTKDQLSEPPLNTVRCGKCQRFFSEEMIQTIYSITPLGKSLIEKSKWMTIWITELLLENGVKNESIKWGAQANGEDLDIMVDDFGTRIFFELKDREFGLGDAYPFAFRISRYGGDFGIIATMSKVSADAKRFFEEETSRYETLEGDIDFFEGQNGIEEGIKIKINQISKFEAQRLMKSFGFGFDLWPIIQFLVAS